MSSQAKISLLIISDKVKNRFHTTSSSWWTPITGISVCCLHIYHKSVAFLGKSSKICLILHNTPTVTWELHDKNSVISSNT